MARTRVGPPGIPARETRSSRRALLERGYDACEIDFEGGFWMDYPWAEKLGEVARAADIALSVHAPLFGFMGHLEARAGSSPPRSARSTGAPASQPRAVPRWSCSTPASCSAARARTRSIRRRTARHVARAARGQGPRGALRDRGDGPRPRPRLGRRRRRDLRANGLGPPGARLRPHARDQRRRVPRSDLFAEALRRSTPSRPGHAVPHPLLRHRLREPQREAPPALRRGDAPRRSAPGGPRAV